MGLNNEEIDHAHSPRRAGQEPEPSKGTRSKLHREQGAGTLSDIHENVISPGVTIPWHFHQTEEVIVVLEGNGECRGACGTEAYSAGDVIIIPDGMKHSLHNSGDTPIRQICFFPGDPATTFLEEGYPDQTIEVFNPSEWAKSKSPASTQGRERPCPLVLRVTAVRS